LAEQLTPGNGVRQADDCPVKIRVGDWRLFIVKPGDGHDDRKATMMMQWPRPRKDAVTDTDFNWTHVSLTLS
jgi:hypothetical protein